MDLGIVKGYEIRQNKDGTHDKTLLQVEMIPDTENDENDIRTVEFMTQAGEDINPAIGSRILVIEVSKGYQIGTASTDDITPETDSGEYEIYGTNGTIKKCQLKMGSDGLITIQNELEILMTLLSDFIDEIKAITTQGSPANHTVTPASQAALEAIKTRMATLFGS